MIHKKILFSTLIVFFLFVLIFSSLLLNNIVTFSDPVSYASQENPYQSLQCFPIYPQTPTIILRLDDIQANVYKDIRFTLIDEILQRNMSLVVALIPKNIEYDRELRDYLREKSIDTKIEIAQHGALHDAEEFKTMDEQEAVERIQEGFKKINRNIGVYPLTFVPPSNEYSSGTIAALKKIGFKTVSAKENEYYFDGDLFFLGKTTETYDFANSRFISAEEVIDACEEGLALRNICVITIHPQDYLDDQDEIDEERYQEFIKLLDELKKKDVVFKTPREMISCIENSQ